ncbi:MAG TPA: hypothetical protein VEX69_01385 [Candidatus Limnocylindria bacterium]|nr:hypothetical protein [Candidatus Limnocylindria bacterium]
MPAWKFKAQWGIPASPEVADQRANNIRQQRPEQGQDRENRSNAARGQQGSLEGRPGRVNLRLMAATEAACRGAIGAALTRRAKVKTGPQVGRGPILAGHND